MGRYLHVWGGVSRPGRIGVALLSDALATDHTAAGADIVSELLARSALLLQGSFFWDQLATLLLIDPAAASFAEAEVRVVTDGPSGGSPVQDDSATAVSHAVAPDAVRFESSFLAGLRRAEPRSRPFTLAGTLRATFDALDHAASAPFRIGA